ncbi:MAG TPA: helix-turn-helix domain-containing protein [Bryobacteraceae bacterium]|nr:helix-turn-helix domain-containing protein [Bryobacteraceae bacterium]
MSAPSLTTGKAAQLCSVKPDTVLKWIKSGRLPAHRTAGGHYRVEERDLTPLLSSSRANEKAWEEHAALCSRPMRCWEYMNHGPGSECQDCVVYKARASWCFRMANLVRGDGHEKRFCTGACQECPYYRRVHGLPTNVLVITQDEKLIQELSRREYKTVAFRYARRGYDASAIVDVFRPAFVICDQAILESLGVTLLEAFVSDPRAAGVRIVVAVRKGMMPRRIHANGVFATIEEPFQAEEVVALINRMPIETLDPAPDRT